MLMCQALRQSHTYALSLTQPKTAMCSLCGVLRKNNSHQLDIWYWRVCLLFKKETFDHSVFLYDPQSPLWPTITWQAQIFIMEFSVVHPNQVIETDLEATTGGLHEEPGLGSGPHRGCLILYKHGRQRVEWRSSSPQSNKIQSAHLCCPFDPPHS